MWKIGCPISKVFSRLSRDGKCALILTVAILTRNKHYKHLITLLQVLHGEAHDFCQTANKKEPRLTKLLWRVRPCWTWWRGIYVRIMMETSGIHVRKYHHPNLDFWQSPNIRFLMVEPCTRINDIRLSPADARKCSTRNISGSSFWRYCDKNISGQMRKFS